VCIPDLKRTDKVYLRKFDAAHVDIPFDLQAKKKGLNVLDLPEIPVIHNPTICTTTTFVEKNKELTINFLKALIEAMHFFKTKKEETVDIIYENLRQWRKQSVCYAATTRLLKKTHMLRCAQSPRSRNARTPLR